MILKERVLDNIYYIFVIYQFEITSNLYEMDISIGKQENFTFWNADQILDFLFAQNY